MLVYYSRIEDVNRTLSDVMFEIAVASLSFGIGINAESVLQQCHTSA